MNQPHRGKRHWWRLLDNQGRSGQRGRIQMSRPLPLAGRKPPHIPAGARPGRKPRGVGLKVQVYLCLLAIIVLVVLAYVG